MIKSLHDSRTITSGTSKSSAGGGWVLFHKPPMDDFEVYNDFNLNLANLFRCVRDRPAELVADRVC